MHGHNAKIEIYISTKKLNSMQMVIDFNEISKIAKEWLDKNLDHKLILSKKDPLIKILEKTDQKLFILDKNPTAEYLSEFIYKQLSKLGLKINKVIFWENDKSAAIYEK